MSKSNLCALAIIAGLAIAGPALAQTQPQSQQDGNATKIVQPGSDQAGQSGDAGQGADKQKTQGSLPDLGPGSKAFYGNTVHAKD